MNEVSGSGITIVTDLPRVLREFGAACRRDRVQGGAALDDYATRYFSKLAGCHVTGESKAQKEGLVTLPEEPKKEVNGVVASPQPLGGDALVSVPNPYSNSENAAAIKIQALQRGRQVRTRIQKGPVQEWIGFSSKLQVLPDAKKVDLTDGRHIISIIHRADEGEVRSVVFAVHDNDAGRVWASELTQQTLPSLIPQNFSYASFWAAIRDVSPDAISFSASVFPSPVLTFLLHTGRAKSSIELPMADIPNGEAAVREYFEEPYN